MTDPQLDRLLVNLDVAVDAFAICEVRRGLRLVAGASEAIEVHYVLAGTMHLMVADAETIVCGPGSIVAIPPGLPQTMAADDGPSRDVDPARNCAMTRGGMLLIDAAAGGAGDLRVVCGLIMANLSGSFGLLDGIRHPIAEDFSGNELVRRSYARMLDEIDTPGLGSRALTGALMKACLMLLLRRHFEGESEASLLGPLCDPRLGKAVAAVLEEPAARHSVAGLASVAGMSRSAFAREFSKALDITPMEFVTRTRLHHAAQMLRTTTLPVKMIAGLVGFASRSHFSRAFRDFHGDDPTAFRGRRATPRPGRDASRRRQTPPHRRRGATTESRGERG